MNLIITCQRNFEEQTILEIRNSLERFGDTNPIIEKTIFSGNWSGFNDSASGIADYHYAIGTTSGGTATITVTGPLITLIKSTRKEPSRKEN